MLRAIQSVFSARPPPPPLPEFPKSWNADHISNHVFYFQRLNDMEANFYFITEYGLQFTNPRPTAGLTSLPLEEIQKTMPRHMLLLSFFNLIQTAGYKYLCEESGVYMCEAEGGETPFVILRVQATKRPLAHILTTFHAKSVGDLHTIAEDAFGVTVTRQRFTAYGPYFDIFYDLYTLKNLANLPFQTTGIYSAEALIAHFNTLRNVDEDVARLGALSIFEEFQDPPTFLDLLKIYCIEEVQFPSLARRGEDVIPAYIRWLYDRVNACQTFDAYLHQASSALVPADQTSVRAVLREVEDLLETKRESVTSYFIKFALYNALDRDEEESGRKLMNLQNFMKTQLSGKWPATVLFRPVTSFTNPDTLLCIQNKFLSKILGFQQGTQVFVGFQESASGDVQLQNGERVSYAPLAPFKILLNPTGDIERFYYCFCANEPDFDAFFAKTDDQLRAEFHTSPLYTFKSGEPLGLEIFCKRKKDVLIDTSTNHRVESIRFNEDLYDGSLLLEDQVVVNKGRLSEWEIGRESGIYYALIFEWQPWTVGGILDKTFCLAPQIILDNETHSRVQYVQYLYENVQQIILKHIQGDKLRRLYATTDPYISGTVLNVEIWATSGSYPVIKDGLRIKKRIVMPDISKEKQLSRFGFFIPSGTVIDLDLTPSQFFTQEQINAMRRYSSNYNLQELIPFFDSVGGSTTHSAIRYFSTNIDILPRILEQETRTRFLDKQISVYVRQWNPDLGKYALGKKFLLEFHNEDNSLKTLTVQIGVGVPDFSLRVEVYPNRPCFLPGGYFWPARVFVQADDTGTKNIMTEIYNSFRNIPEPQDLRIPRSLLATMRSLGTLADEDRTYKIKECTTIVERKCDSPIAVSSRPTDHETYPFSSWYTFCRDQFNNTAPHSRIAFSIINFYTYPFTNKNALDTYFKVAGWPRYIPNSRKVFAMGGGARRKKTYKNRKARRRRTYRTNRYRNRSLVRG